MTRTVRWASVLTATALVGVGLGATGPAQAASAAGPQVVGVDAVVEVLPEGPVVTAVVLEYDRRINLRGVELDPGSFDVRISRDGTVTERTETDAYVSRDSEPGVESRNGTYVVVELAATDRGAGVLTYSGGVNRRIDLEGAYLVDVDDVTDNRGRMVLPATGDAVANDDVVRLVVDDFSIRSTTGTSGTTLRYGLYTPEPRRGSQELVPLVVALHGGGERGTDGVVQLLGNQLAVAFADPERQATDRSIVLAPQGPPPALQPTNGLSVWEVPQVQSTLMELIEQTIATQPVDPDRVYLTGLSMGSMGSFDILPKYPDLFAAALTTTGLGDQPSAPALAQTPMWATHSVDDGTVPYDRADSDIAVFRAIQALGVPVVYDEWAANLPDAENEARARVQWDAAEAAGAEHLFTTWTAGTTPVNSHFAWVPTYSNDVMLDWLFSHERD